MAFGARRANTGHGRRLRLALRLDRLRHTLRLPRLSVGMARVVGGSGCVRVTGPAVAPAVRSNVGVGLIVRMASDAMGVTLTRAVAPRSAIAFVSRSPANPALTGARRIHVEVGLIVRVTSDAMRATLTRALAPRSAQAFACRSPASPAITDALRAHVSVGLIVRVTTLAMRFHGRITLRRGLLASWMGSAGVLASLLAILVGLMPRLSSPSRLAALHGMHALTRLAIAEVPPWLRGTMWSTVSA